MIIIIHSSKRKIKVNLFKFLLSLVLISSCVFGTVSFSKSKNTAMSANEYTQTVVVTVGETLWSIASECNDGSYDTRRIVNEIISLNKLSSPDINIGQTLEIPAKYSIS